MIVIFHPLAFLFGLCSFWNARDPSLVSLSTWFGLGSLLCLVVLCVLLPRKDLLKKPYYFEVVLSSEISAAFAGVSMICWCLRGYPVLVRYEGGASQQRGISYLVPLMAEVVSFFPSAIALGLMFHPNFDHRTFDKLIALQVAHVVLVLIAIIAGFIEVRGGHRRLCAGLSFSLIGAIINAAAVLLLYSDLSDVCDTNNRAHRKACATQRVFISSFTSLWVTVLAICLWSCRIFYLAGEVAGRQGRPSYLTKFRFQIPLWLAVLTSLPALVSATLLSIEIATKKFSDLVLPSVALGLTILSLVSQLKFAHVGKIELVTLRTNPLSPAWLYGVIAVCGFAVACHLSSRNKPNPASFGVLMLTSGFSFFCALGWFCARSFAAGDAAGRNQQLLTPDP
eukprot:c19698_g1_i2.p1 GENE.c19698_g1_i2~~c19698_g1_i2.p1  ORF type:complete len:395 (+),score=64.45 c19698_g1_i2:223-1407(+)